MAEIISDKFLLSATILAINTSGTRPTSLIPDNCHTIIIYNPDATNSVYVAIGATADVLVPTGVGGSVPFVIPPSTSATINMGSSSIRPQSTPTASDQLIYQSSAGSIQVNITYISANVF
tara:strand:+ start:4747 stop:5106 length:360 start_codon:yes stop_codon:yes gene_type:complete